ncbi:MAG: hypothetical protein M1831_003231 [Alyxoria varia]|nr:MAG: hypothetical protein M1831_003231 [Alyxoria varia]
MVRTTVQETAYHLTISLLKTLHSSSSNRKPQNEKTAMGAGHSKDVAAFPGDAFPPTIDPPAGIEPNIYQCSHADTDPTSSSAKSILSTDLAYVQVPGLAAPAPGKCGRVFQPYVRNEEAPKEVVRLLVCATPEANPKEYVEKATALKALQDWMGDCGGGGEERFGGTIPLGESYIWGSHEAAGRNVYAVVEKAPCSFDGTCE